MLTYSEADLSLWCSVFCFRIWHGSFCQCEHFLVQKPSDFLKFMVCPHGQEGREIQPVRTFFGQGGKGVNFSRFCVDVVYGRPLMKR